MSQTIALFLAYLAGSSPLVGTSPVMTTNLAPIPTLATFSTHYTKKSKLDRKKDRLNKVIQKQWKKTTRW